MRELTKFRIALNDVQKFYEQFHGDITVNDMFMKQMNALLDGANLKLSRARDEVEDKVNRLHEFRQQESVYISYFSIINKAWEIYNEEKRKTTPYINRVIVHNCEKIKLHLYIPAERIPQYIEELSKVSELLQNSDPYLDEERNVILDKYKILQPTFTWFLSNEAQYEGYCVPGGKWDICMNYVKKLKQAMPEFLEKKRRLGLQKQSAGEGLGNKIEDLINRCQSIDYKKLSKDELCKWHLTCEQYINKLKEAVANITEDTLENRKMLIYIAKLQGPLSELDKKFYSRYIDTPETKRRLSKAEIQAKNFDQLKIFMWGKRLFPDKMNKDDSWYENESRLVAVPYQEDIQTYLKNYGLKVRNGREARIEIEGKEDTDEWGWLCLANTFLPFCIRFVKTLSNETTLYHFYTFNVVTSKYAYDFDEAITDRIYWLRDNGLI